MTYFISDLHFGHRNVMAYDKRPFSDDIEKHDEFLIQQWNSVVNTTDDVWILGDISWYPAQKTIAIFERLNGIKHLVVGNHDKKLLRCQQVRELFIEITDYKELEFDDGSGVVLSHYPIPCYNKHFYGWHHLYGHVHSTFEWDMIEKFQEDMRAQGNLSSMYNCGCMMPYMNYKPRTLTQILEANYVIVCGDAEKEDYNND